METRQKSNDLYVAASFIIALMVGAIFQSWLAMFIVAAALLAGGLYAGEIRPWLPPVMVPPLVPGPSLAAVWASLNSRRMWSRSRRGCRTGLESHRRGAFPSSTVADELPTGAPSANRAGTGRAE